MAERFFREMLEAGITPDVQAINSLINAFSKAGSPDQALKVPIRTVVFVVLCWSFLAFLAATTGSPHVC